MATKQVKCHEGRCGPCSLCRQSSTRYTHAEKLTEEEYSLLVKVNCSPVERNACICYSCIKQLKRNKENPHFKPRWKCKLPQVKVKCSVNKCPKFVDKHTKLASAVMIEEALQQKLESFTVTAEGQGEVSVGLCTQHYNALYTSLDSSRRCDSCRVKARVGQVFNRHCPSPQIVNTYLKIVSNEPSQLSSESIVCTSCYKHFCIIIDNSDSIQELNKVTEFLNESDKQELKNVISSLTKQLQKLIVTTESDLFEYAILKVGISLGKILVDGEATLLPLLYEEFATTVRQQAVESGLVVREYIPTSRWVLSKLHTFYDKKLEIQCRHRRYGTMLLHKKCDLRHALSIALGKGSKPNTTSHSKQETQCFAMEHTPQSLTIEQQLQNVANFLNKIMHERGKALNAEFSNYPDKIRNFSLSDIITQNLLTFLEELTKSVRQSRRKLFHEPNPHSPDKEVKSIRLMFALSVLQLCTNNTCNAPFQLAVTESVICHGGKQTLVRILNRLGVAASIDTSKRSATLVVTERKKTGISKDLLSNTFTVATIDNVDILQTHAFVSGLDASRSWHGTSTQLIQPLTLSGDLSQEDLCRDRATTGTHRSYSQATSPINSPIAVSKHKRQRRTLTEHHSPHTTFTLPDHRLAGDSGHFQTVQRDDYAQLYKQLTISEFKPDYLEIASLDDLRQDLFRCVCLRAFAGENTLPGLVSLMNCVTTSLSDKELSRVVYAEIVSERADSKPTLLGVISRLQQVFLNELGQKYVVLVGDGKTYQLLKEIYYEYKSELQWLIIYPGDWHVLLNYQRALMKPYADAGLSSLGKTSGHRGETLNSLVKATNFRRTHEFLLQAFEALYRYFLNLYIKQYCSEGDITTDISKIFTDLVTQFMTCKSATELETFRETSMRVLNSTATLLKYKDFKVFIENLSMKNDTVRFWYQFLSIDCFAYLALFIGLRYRNWNIRVGSIKLLPAIFTAYDHQTYQQVLAEHLRDLLMLPQSVLKFLKKGAFCVRLSKTEWHGIALDECHEMCINKDAKMAVIRPSVHKMDFLSNHLSFRAHCVKNLESQIFPEKERIGNSHKHTPSSRDKKGIVNVNLMTDAFTQNDMTTKSGLWNIFEEKQASPEQTHDLLMFRLIGQKAFDYYVETRFLNVPSTDAPKRKKRLTTFTITATQKKKEKLIDYERKISQRFLKRQLNWITEQGLHNVDTDSLFGPISVVPRALVDSKGLPQKSSKASTTGFFEKRYTTPPVVIHMLPQLWIPDSVILEGMFLIQTTPLPSAQHIKEYAMMLFKQYIKPHLTAGVTEVHVVFDSPGSLTETPKQFEQKRRDTNSSTATDHTCSMFESSSPVPSPWRSLLSCRVCKKAFTEYLAEEFLKIAPSYINEYQTVICNIGTEVFSASADGVPLPCQHLSSNADEGDLKVWLHCQHASGTRILIYSRDTDVYHIGLTMSQIISTKHVIIQLSKSYKQGGKFIDLKAFVQAVHTDPDLSSITQSNILPALQAIYVSTGCDYISFFSGLGKITFLSTFFQYASFIISDHESIGFIDIGRTLDTSFFSFLRLVGCAYFKKHTSAFEQPSPLTLYQSIDIADTNQHHIEWIRCIRKAVWLRADKESDNVPSTDALRLHWK